VIDLETSFDGCRFAIGIRNANNKRFRLSCTVSLRVFVRHNLAFQGDYSAVLAKRMQRNFEPMRRQVESCRTQQLSAEAAKLTIYRAFMEAIWKSQSTWQRESTNSISSRSRRSLAPERCGAFRTHSHRPSRNSIRFHNYGPRRNLAAFLKQA
jgi:hypothetical protein